MVGKQTIDARNATRPEVTGTTNRKRIEGEEAEIGGEMSKKQ
jgi:hypothetical protein